MRIQGADLVASKLALGCEPLGGVDWGAVDEQAASEAVSKALDVGISVFDTADVYGLGRSEEMLSRALGARRHDVVICTKFGVRWSREHHGGRAATWRDASPQYLHEALDDSLRRLRVECIPLYFIHYPDSKVPLAETASALLRCQEAGKIRCIGLSNFSAPEIRLACELMPVAAVQLELSLVQRDAEASILPLCVERGISVFVYGTLAQGLLTGKYTSAGSFAGNDRRHRLAHFQPSGLERHSEVVRRAAGVAKLHKRATSQVAIRWALEQPGVACAIVGAKSASQVTENTGVFGWRLSEEEQMYLGTAGRGEEFPERVVGELAGLHSVVDSKERRRRWKRRRREN